MFLLIHDTGAFSWMSLSPNKVPTGFSHLTLGLACQPVDSLI